ncbi:MAG: hypothetical protein KME16_26800 [Scytolyngbya sp. HA4215-MV1]|nr:hypothetical protein [Scytolyngbya sp. HA4215-MV1]
MTWVDLVSGVPMLLKAVYGERRRSSFSLRLGSCQGIGNSLRCWRGMAQG